MVLVRKKKKTEGMQIPPAKVDLTNMAESLLQHPEDIPKVLKTKKFILARLEGKNVKQSNIAAGFYPSRSQDKSLSTPVAKVLLDELVVSKIPDPEVATRLREMWDARKKMVVTNPATKMPEVIDLGGDFEQQKYAMDKRLSLGGYVGGELPENRQAQIVTSITFVSINPGAINSTGPVVEVPAQP